MPYAFRILSEGGKLTVLGMGLGGFPPSCLVFRSTGGLGRCREPKQTLKVIDMTPQKDLSFTTLAAHRHGCCHPRRRPPPSHR